MYRVPCTVYCGILDPKLSKLARELCIRQQADSIELNILSILLGCLQKLWMKTMLLPKKRLGIVPASG